MKMLRVIAVLAMGVVYASFVGCAPATNDTTTKAKPAADSHDHDHDEEGHDHDEAGHEHDEAGHEHHDHPESYADAMTHVEEHLAELKAFVTDGKMKEADAALHHLSHLTEEFGELAEKAKLSVEDQTAVKKAADDLMDALDPLHDMLHGKEAADKDAAIAAHEAQSAKIDAAVADLKAKAPKE
ncbi:hypothetical protein [Lignipirellula cremea]|uniref:Uncharacterized protein n=1 Tax=Lignipirellula cremea TaxID=2528010 RepID=A0A518DY79_9BACT|nr:hypothetical protein [Lignipirellula cremea]QDU96798.1 hypothetical protein Pla8534_46190 [Lignipirellula cremea]